MKWIILLVVIVVVVLALRLGAVRTLPLAAAREHLQKGALLVDVRSVAEYDAQHVASAVNIPLDQVQEALPRRVPDKGRVILLHCRSGVRSGLAERRLRALGYTNAFNVGSLARAQRLVRGAAQ